MPMYKNRVAMEPDTELRHYTTLAALVQILSGRRLRLTRVDTFQDPFEGRPEEANRRPTAHFLEQERGPGDWRRCTLSEHEHATSSLSGSMAGNDAAAASQDPLRPCELLDGWP